MAVTHTPITDDDGSGTTGSVWNNAWQIIFEGNINAALAALDAGSTGLTAEIAARIAADVLKAPLASPALTGVPTAPTAAGGTNTTQIATTAFARAEIAALVAAAPATLDTLNELALALGSDPNFAATMTAALALKAPLASPTLTGTPAAPTAAPGTNTTQIATTAFVRANGATVGITTPNTTGAITAEPIPTGTGDLITFHNNNGLKQIQGMVAGTDGQLWYHFAVHASGQVDFYHNHASGTALGKLKLCATTGFTSLAAGVGVAVFQYDATSTIWRLVFHEQGAWITPAYNAADYFATAPMTWTVDAGDVITDSYYLRGRILFRQIVLATTSITGTPGSALKRTVPAGFSMPVQTDAIGASNPNGAGYAAAVFALVTGTTEQFFPSMNTAATWTLSTNTTALYGQWNLPVT